MSVHLEEMLAACKPYTQQGQLPSYIPALKKGDPKHLGVCLLSCDGQLIQAGDCGVQFSIQSIVKPILLLQALLDNGVGAVRAHVGVEATGKPFDAINYTDQVLDSQHLNPMVNMGAIAVCSLIRGSSYQERFHRLLALTRLLAGEDARIQVNEDVYRSEKASGNKNRALAYLLKPYGIIQDDVEEVLDCYFHACAISTDCVGLARIGCVLANKGCQPGSQDPIIPPEYARFVNAILTTCGMYDGSGDFAVRAGVPAKSGVGGGILAVMPGSFGLAAFSPRLDESGNSVRAQKAVRYIINKLGLNVFKDTALTVK